MEIKPANVVINAANNEAVLNDIRVGYIYELSPRISAKSSILKVCRLRQGAGVSCGRWDCF